MEAMKYNPASEEWDAEEVTEQEWIEDCAKRNNRHILSIEEYHKVEKAAKRYRRKASPELAALACNPTQA